MPIPRVQGFEESIEHIRETLLDTVDAAEQELGSGHMASVWKRLEKRSRDGSVVDIRRYLGGFELPFQLLPVCHCLP